MVPMIANLAMTHAPLLSRWSCSQRHIACRCFGSTPKSPKRVANLSAENVGLLPRRETHRRRQQSVSVLRSTPDPGELGLELPSVGQGHALEGASQMAG